MVSSRTLVLKATSRGTVRRCIDLSLHCGVAPNISAELDRDRSQQHGQMLGQTAYRERRSQAQRTEWRREFVRLRGCNFCLCAPNSNGSRTAAGDQASASLVSHIRPEPFERDEHAPTEADQEIDMRDAPQQPAGAPPEP